MLTASQKDLIAAALSAGAVAQLELRIAEVLAATPDGGFASVFDPARHRVATAIVANDGAALIVFDAATEEAGARLAWGFCNVAAQFALAKAAEVAAQADAAIGRARH